MKIAQWIRGSGEISLNKFQGISSKTFGCGREFEFSNEKWRTLIRQAGFLDRKLSIGSGNNMVAFVAFATSSSGIHRLEEDVVNPVMLPVEFETQAIKQGQESKVKDNARTIPRRGKGCHALTVLKTLIANKENWFLITNSNGYNFPGVFDEPYPKRLGYCENITQLPNYEETDPHFMFADIQLGKEKARPKRTVKIDIDRVSESIFYRFVPCGGVKLCGKHTEGCLFVAPTSSIKSCRQHPDAPLERTKECPVLFFYVWPEDPNDNRRCLTGIVRSGDLQSHNHPMHSETKIPAKVDSRALVDNPHLKTSDLIVGMPLIVY